MTCFLIHSRLGRMGETHLQGAALQGLRPQTGRNAAKFTQATRLSSSRARKRRLGTFAGEASSAGQKNIACLSTILYFVHLDGLCRNVALIARLRPCGLAWDRAVLALRGYKLHLLSSTAWKKNRIKSLSTIFRLFKMASAKKDTHREASGPLCSTAWKVGWIKGLLTTRHYHGTSALISFAPTGPCRGLCGDALDADLVGSTAMRNCLFFFTPSLKVVLRKPAPQSMPPCPLPPYLSYRYYSLCVSGWGKHEVVRSSDNES